MTVRRAHEKGIDLNGADIYLYGHWWACQKCWDTMIAAGIRNVYLLKDSETLFNDQVTKPRELQNVELSLYVSGPLTHLKNQEIKKLYEQIGTLGEAAGFKAHVPHLHSDPFKHADLSSEVVYKHDKQKVTDADLMVCYVGETSLGTGMELEIAVQEKTLVVLLSEEGVKVSRMVLGSPAVIDHVTFTSFEDALAKLRDVFTKFVKTAKQPNISSRT
jgi:2'-deoxynucleoside 5'-phosphate N-hydrolase